MKNLINQILATPMAPENWENVLDEFNSVFDLKSSAILSYNETSNLKSNLALSSFLRTKLTPRILEYIKSSEDDDIEAHKALMQMPSQIFYTEEEVLRKSLNVQKNGSSSYMRNFIFNLGITDRLACKLNSSGPWADCFIVHTENLRQTNYVASDTSISLVMPIISGALSLGRYFQALRSKYQAVLTVLDGLGLGIFIIHPNGDVIEHNSEAQRILDLDDGLCLSNSRELKAKSYDKNAELNHVIQNALSCFHGNHQKSSNLVSINRPSKEYDYLVSVKPLFDNLAELEANLMCAFVIVIDPSRENSLSAEGLKVLGQLSTAETDIVDLLIKGLRPADVAQQRDVSINTVKTQLKTISRKLNCSSQSDLIRVAAATKIPIEEINN